MWLEISKWAGLRVEINKSIWKLQSVSEKQSLGSASRRKSRAKERRDSQRLLLDILTKRHPDWLDGSVTHIRLAECEALLQELEQVKSSDAQYKYMHNFLCESLARGNKLFIWEAQIPPPVQTFINEIAHRGETDFHMMAAFRKLQQHFLTDLQTGRLENAKQNTEQVNSAEAMLVIILEYAIFFGGLVVLEELQCLLDTAADIKPFSDGQNTWLDLYVTKRSGSITANPITSESKLRRWFIDIPLMALLQQFQKSVSETRISNKLTVHAVLKSRFHIFKSKGNSFTSVTGLLKTAALAWELDNPDTPGFLSSVVKGNLSSHSLPAHVFVKLYKEKLLKPLQKSNEDTKELLKSKSARYRQEFSVTEFFDFQQDKKRLRALSKLFDSGERKSSRPNMMIQLKSTLHQFVQPSPLLILLVSWAEHLLRHGSRFKKQLAIDSVKNYLSRVGNCWLNYAGQNFSLDMDELQWEHFYHQILSSQKGQKSLANLIGRLGEFHHYLAQEWGAERLPDSVFRINQNNFAVVRSNYVNETEFASLCQKLSTDFGSIECRMLLSIAILAYRCGMRKGEIIKLKVSDLDFYNECLIRIRSNEFGNNKSESAYRIIPFHLLASEKEQGILRDYLNFCRELNQNNQNRLLFFLPMTSGSKLTSSYIDGRITSLLKQICRDESVNFHTLRHAFINNLYIRLFVNEQDWMFAPANYPQINLSLSDLAGDAATESGKALFSIANIAGHASPEETLLSYCHFVDIHQKLCSNPLPVENVELLSVLFDMRIDTYTRFCLRNKHNFTMALHKKLLRKWDKHKIQQIKSNNKVRKVKTSVVGDIEGPAIDAAAITLILNSYDKGKSVIEIAKATSYKGVQVARIVKVATVLSQIKTAKGHSRLISQKRKPKTLEHNGELRTPIAPLLPREATLKTDALKMVDIGIKILGSGNAQRRFKEALNYYINNVVTTKPGVTIDRPKSALLMINFFKELAGSARVFVNFQAVTSEQFLSVNTLLVEKNIPFSGQIMFVDRLKPYLCINHPSAKHNELRSSASLHYAIHLLAILCRLEEIAE